MVALPCSQPPVALPVRPSVAAGIALACTLLAPFGGALAFGFDQVAERARELAAKPYVPASVDLPADLKNLGYDQYRDIRFKPEQALWRAQGLPFEVMFFHPSGLHALPVTINEVTVQGVRRIAFDRRDFEYGKSGSALSPERWTGLGFAGFRVHCALNTPNYKDELVAFLDASYFRALGRGQRYGLSARALAIDTIGAQGEEFPRFVEFWLERPTARASSLVIEALLDSPRATGAYRFTLHPGQDTVADVRARLYLRAGVATLGLAPLTSMFLHGENQPRAGDFRPEVHDSDGLMIATGDGAAGEWLWRPLINPSQPLVSSFAAHELKGFGLMQRDRSFASYEDAEARYERRPSAWITTQGWGAGRLELVQLPTRVEANDNVVAYWVPAHVPAPGEPLDLAYRMHWQGDRQQRPPVGWTVQSRRGFATSWQEPDPRQIQYVVDFDGPDLRALPPDASVQAQVSAGANARVVERNAYRNQATGTWRMTVCVSRFQPSQSVELRAFLQLGDQALTETWTTLIAPD